jgi:hypothetical protein
LEKHGEGGVKLSFIINHATLPDVTLPLLPYLCRETGPAELQNKPYPGDDPIIFSIGGKGPKLVVEGYIYVAGQTKAQLKTNYIDKLRNLRCQKITLDTPDDMYDGDWIMEDFQFDEYYQHPAGFKYKMLFIKGSIMEVL